MTNLRLKKDSFATKEETLLLALNMGFLFLLGSPASLTSVFTPVVAGADLKDANEGVRLK